MSKSSKSFEEMQKVAEEVETPATLREKIQALQNEHLEDLRELYTCYTRDYQSDTKDLYKSYEEVRISEADERTRDLIQGWHDRLEVSKLVLLDRCEADVFNLQGFCIQHQNSLYINSPLIAEFGQLRHGYLKRLLHLQKQLQDETKHESETRRRELARFPKNSSELTKFPLEAQVRVAKFLVADAKDRERMKDEFMWPSLATQPLIDEFQKDVSRLRAFRQPDMLTITEYLQCPYACDVCGLNEVNGSEKASKSHNSGLTLQHGLTNCRPSCSKIAVRAFASLFGAIFPV